MGHKDLRTLRLPCFRCCSVLWQYLDLLRIYARHLKQQQQQQAPSPTRTGAVNRVVIWLITRDGWTSVCAFSTHSLSFLLLFSIRLNAMKCEGLIFFVIFFLCLALMKCICHKSVNTGNKLRLRENEELGHLTPFQAPSSRPLQLYTQFPVMCVCW